MTVNSIARAGARASDRVQRVHLVICDFDGTVTARDTNSVLAERFAPRAFAQVEQSLVSGPLTLREVLAAEYAEMTATEDEIVRYAVENVPLRAGFAEFVEAARAAGVHLQILSAGFRELIEPMLASAGIAGLNITCNSVTFAPSGATIQWRDLDVCDVCDEECKRADVTERRGTVAGTTARVSYIGDGYSDRCGSLAADTIYARDGLAEWLRSEGQAFTAWDDFHDLIGHLGWA